MMMFQALSAVALAAFAAAVPVTDSQQGSQAGLYPVKQLWQGKKGSWLENLAVRSNGNIIGTRLDVPEVYEFAPPSYSEPKLVAKFPGTLGLTGIVETAPDVFAVLPGNFSLQTVSAPPGTFSVWSIDFKGNTSDGGKGNKAPVVKKVAVLPQVDLANGIGYLPESNSVLVADSVKGVIFRVGLADGAVQLAINNTLLAADPNEGVNGVKVNEASGLGGKKQQTLFFSNTNTGVVGSFNIDPRTGRTVGGGRVIGTVDKSNFPRPATPADRGYNDDLVLSPDKRSLYVAGAKGNTVIRFDVASGGQRIVAGNLNSTDIAEPTAVAFGRRAADRNVLYVVTGGGQGGPINGTVIVGAQLLAIDLSRGKP